MTDNNKNEAVYSKSVIEFLTVANEYCLFTEKAEQYSREDIFQYYLKIGPLLYLKGALLPEMNDNESEIPERYLTEEAYEIIYQALKKKIGDADAFWCIDDEGKEDNSVKMDSIAEQIADIYQDMKDFVMLYQKNTHAAKENAVAECHKLFISHWGIRTISLQQALHKILFSNMLSTSAEENPEIEL